jgi:hypothetical protein
MCTNLRLIITGTKDMRIESMTEGRRPLIMPMILVGIFVNQCSQVKFSRYETFDISPTN